MSNLRLTRVLLDGHAVVHLVDPEDLRLTAVGTQFVILAHDERFDGFGGAHFRAEPAKAAAGQVEIEVIQNFDFLSGLAVAAQRNQIVGARLGALVTNDTGLRA